MAVDVALSWTLSPTTTSEVDGQRIYRTSTSSPTFPSDYTQVDSVGDSQTTYTDTGAPEDEALTYAVTAFNSAGESDPTTDSVDTTVFNPVATPTDTDTAAATGVRTRQAQASSMDTDAIATATRRARAGMSAAVDTGTVAVSATRARVAQATPADTEIVSAVALRTRSVIGNTTDTDTATANSTRVLQAQAAIADTDSRITVIARARIAAATTTDADALSGSATRTLGAQAINTDADSLTAVGTLSVESRLFSTITDTDTLTATGTRTRSGEAETADIDSVTASGARVRGGQVTILDADTVAASSTRTRAGQAAILDADTLAATGTRTRRNVAQVVDTDSLTATSTRPRFGVAAITDMDALTATGTELIFQSEIRWLLDTLITAWPGDGPPNNVAFRNRDEPVTYYHPDDGTDPEALGDYDAVREQAAPLDGFRTISVASDTVGRESRGNKPQYDVTTTLDIWVQDKTSYEHGAADDVADHDTLVAMLKLAINTQIVYPQVVPNADPAGRVDYFDLGITTTEYRSVEFKDQYRTDFTVRLRGRQDTPEQ